MPKTIHLVYPKSEKISTPDAIGRKLFDFLSTKYRVVQHDYFKFGQIKPEIGDVLIGHAHPNPWTIFRRSLDNPNWAKKILLQPFTTDLDQSAFIREVVPRCDLFLAITGEFWRDTYKFSEFSWIEPKFKHVDLAIDRQDFPRIKQEFSPKGKRKFCYIGNNAYWKNFPYFTELAKAFDPDRVVTIGVDLPSVKSLPRMNFADAEAKAVLAGFDFLLMTGYSDANPTVILEAMSWGLIPVVTRQSGYYTCPGIVNIPLNDPIAALDVMNALDQMDELDLKNLVGQNDAFLETTFKWDRFCSDILTGIEEPVQHQACVNQIPLIKEVRSKNYYLKPRNLMSLLKANWKAL